MRTTKSNDRLPPYSVVPDGPQLVVHLGREPLDALRGRRASSVLGQVAGPGELHVHADRSALLDLARLHLRGEREAPDVSERIPWRAPGERRLGHVHVELLGGARLARRRRAAAPSSRASVR